MAHRGFYRVRASKHEKAARESSSSRDKAGHKEIASGYRKLAGSSSTSHKIGKKRGKRRAKRRHGLTKHNAKHVRAGLAKFSSKRAKKRAVALRNLKKAHAARRRHRR